MSAFLRAGGVLTSDRILRPTSFCDGPIGMLFAYDKLKSSSLVRITLSKRNSIALPLQGA